MLKYLLNLKNRYCQFVLGGYENKTHQHYTQNKNVTHLIGWFVHLFGLTVSIIKSLLKCQYIGDEHKAQAVTFSDIEVSYKY